MYAPDNILVWGLTYGEKSFLHPEKWLCVVYGTRERPCSAGERELAGASITSLTWIQWSVYICVCL